MKLPFVDPMLIRLRTLPASRRRLIIVAAVAIVVLVPFGLGVLVGYRAAHNEAAAAQARTLAARNEDLRGQLAVLQRDHQVALVADRLLQRDLADREEEIRGLRADQAFYSKLVGADAQREGLTVHSVALTSVGHSRAFNFVVTLIQSARGSKESHGRMTVAIEGVRGDKLALLDWAALGGPAGVDGLPFAFKYFQQVRGTLMLPPGFTPNRVRIMLKPQGGAEVTRVLSWSEALRGDPGDAP